MKHPSRRCLHLLCCTCFWRNLCNSLLFYILILPFTSSLEQYSTVAILGTESGYDRGGTDPVCWLSLLEGSANDSIDTLDEALVASISSAESRNNTIYGVRLLPRCFPQTDLSIATTPAVTNTTCLFTETPHEVSITTSINPINIWEELQAAAATTRAFVSNGTVETRFHARIVLCHAFYSGFCNPIALLADHKSVEPNHNLNSSISFAGNNWMLASNWESLPIDETRNNETVRTHIPITLQLPSSMRMGSYFIVAHTAVVMQIGYSAIARLDVADTIISQGVVHVRARPVLKRVSEATKVIVGVIIAFSGSFALFLVVAIIKYRDHAVMHLAQGPFLCAIAAACFVQIVCSFVILPTRDVHCRLFGPLMLVPITFVASCIVARIWRVYRTLFNVSRLGRRRQGRRRNGGRRRDSVVSTLTSIANIPSMANSHFLQSSTRTSIPPTPRANSGLHQAISARETTSLVVALTIPQVILQVTNAILRDRKLVLRIDRSDTIESLTCEEGRFASMAGMIYVTLVFIISVWLAWISRELPSIFNEKDQIYRATSISILTVVAGVALYELLEGSGVSPDLAVLLYLLCSIAVPMSVLSMVVFPKVRRVLSGEKVVLSSVLEGKFSVHQQTISLEGLSRPNAISKESRKVSLREDDPLPSQVEALLFNVQRELHGATNMVTQGRALQRKQVTSLSEQVSKLADELLLIEFANELQGTSEIETATQTREEPTQSSESGHHTASREDLAE